MQQRLIEGSFKQASWQKFSWNTSTCSTPPAASIHSAGSAQMPVYYNSYEDELEKKIYHASEAKEHHDENHREDFAFRKHLSGMTGLFFNNSSQFKIGLASYICQQSSCFDVTFGDAIEQRDHVLDHHGVDIKSTGRKYHMRTPITYNMQRSIFTTTRHPPSWTMSIQTSKT